ncbi:hypothetical protein FAM6012_01521 [Lacticaseibacillus paracasei]|uniref:Uncharacterized protein n=1 Tax=Lacticaseibacillus paracasei TaxID=1597 RepID=A0A8B3GSJ5_LACPA|nr:hypothetical protein FAM6012_01521 [Lacticaseibacillus paracasei]
MQENHDVVHFQLDQPIQPQPTQTKKVPEATKALLISGCLIRPPYLQPS